jgi:hypothetical protein
MGLNYASIVWVNLKAMVGKMAFVTQAKLFRKKLAQKAGIRLTSSL